MQNKNLEIQIRRGSIKDAVAVARQVPELKNSHPEKIYETRMAGKKNLILIAFFGEKKIGFKVGYDKFQDGKNFYTWMGGVLPAFRKNGVAKILAQHQENWVKSNGFENIILKTRNSHRGMLIFALKNNFKIIEVIPYNDIEEHRILLKKLL